MTTPFIDPLPQDPQKSQGVRVFNINAKAWTAALALFTTQFNAAIVWLNNSFGFAVIVDDATESYTLLDADRGKYRRMTATAEKTIIIDESLSDTASYWNFRNVGAENLIFAPVVGVTVTANAGGTLQVPQNGTASLIRVGVDTYELTGQTVAA